MSHVTALEREIAEQPDVVARLLDRLRPDLAAYADLLRSAGSERAVLVARGSSDNAATYARYLWEPWLPATLAAPSLTTVYGAGPGPGLRRAAVVAVSQSGRSPDVVGVVEQARAAGRPTLAVTNDPDSPLAAAADAVLDLGCGPERSVAATKTYTASLAALAALATALGDPRGDDLDRLPDALAAAVAGTTGVEVAVDVVAPHDRGVAVGRGYNLATAHETALKLTELTGALVVPFSPADLMHGPVGAVGTHTPALLVAPPEPATASVLDVAADLVRRGAPVVVLGAATADGAPDEASAHVAPPPGADLADWLTPVVAVVPGQLLAWRVAQARGVEVDRPGGLSKVTLTT